jgi:hypothetical protein
VALDDALGVERGTVTDSDQSFFWNDAPVIEDAPAKT